jgi:branched-chain amino acid transport system substrate-binding protein
MNGCASWEPIERLSKLPQKQVSGRRIRTTRFPAAQYVIHKIIIICLLVLTGCASRPMAFSSLGGTQPLVKIGLAAPFEGLNRPLGYEALAGVKLALAERNATGGVQGYSVELVALNDFGEPDEARLQAREFAADPAVLGVVTGWTDETARASLPVYRQAGLGVVVPWSIHPELADPESGVVLAACDEQRAAEVLAEGAAATSPSRLAVVADGPPATVYVESLKALGMEMQVVSPPDALDEETLQEWIARLVFGRARPPDALIVTTDGALAGEVLLALAVNDWKGATLAGAETGDVHLVDIAGNAAVGLAYVSPAPAGQDLSQAEGSLAHGIKELGPRGVLAYDATSVLLDAIELAIQKDGFPSKQGIVAALPEVRRYGLTGEIAFDRAGRRLDAPVWFYNIVDKSYPGRVLFPQPTTSGK